MGLSINFLGFILFGTCSASWICRFISCQIREVSSFTYLFFSTFPGLPPSSLLLRLWWVKCWTFCCNPIGPWVSGGFFWWWFVCSVQEFLLFCLPVHLLFPFCCRVHPLSFWFQFFLVLTFLRGSSLYFYLLRFSVSLRLSIFFSMCFQHVHNRLLKHFPCDRFNSLSDHSDMSLSPHHWHPLVVLFHMRSSWFLGWRMIFKGSACLFILCCETVGLT